MTRPTERRAAACATLTLVCALFTAGAAHATDDVVVRGVVRDELSAPLAGALVRVHDSRGRTVRELKTGADGAFSFVGLPFGDYSIEALAADRIEGHQHVQVGSSQGIDIDLYCVATTSSDVIVEEREAARPTRAAGSVVTLRKEELRELPKGEDRPITEVVTTQPGFIQDAFGNVYARGNHANIQYQVDGIPIPDSVGSLFAQALPVRLVENLEILTGGLPAEYGNRLAAVVNISSRRGGDTPEGQAQVRYGTFQTVESSASYSRTLRKGLGIFLGGSYLQSQRALDTPAITPILHDDGRSGRAFLRVDYQPSARDRIEVFASYAFNRFQIPIDPTIAPLDPSRPYLVRPTDAYGNTSLGYVPHDTDASETEHELFAAVSLVHSFTRGQLQLTPYYKLSYGALLADAERALGPLADPGSTTSDVIRRGQHAGLVGNFSYAVGKHLIKAGAQLNFLRGDTDYTFYARQAQGGVDPTLTTPGQDHTAALLAGLYLQDQWTRGRLSLSAGLRFDHQHVALSGGGKDDQFGVSPRLGGSFAFTPDLVLRVSTGVNWQPPAPLDVGNAARVLSVIPAGAQVPYDVKAETNVVGEVGLEARVVRRLRLGVTGWGRTAWNQLDNAAIGVTNLIVNYNFERGRAVGVEGKVSLVFRDYLSAFANVSWEIAQGQGIASAKFLFDDESLRDDSWQTLDHVQTLTANLGATLRYEGASLTTLLAYGSGLRTGPANDQSVPQHLRVDATLQYAFDKLPLQPRVAVDVINLFDARYAYRIANGFVGSSYAAPRSVFVRLAIPLTKGGSR